MGLVDRLTELADWCEQHSYEVPVTAREDCLVAVKEFERLVAERDEALAAARWCFERVYRQSEAIKQWPWLESAGDAEGGEI